MFSDQHETHEGPTPRRPWRRPGALAALLAAAALAGCGAEAPAPEGGGSGSGGSGGSGKSGGTQGGVATDDAGLQRIATCMKRNKAQGVQVNQEAATLLPAESKTGAIVATIGGIRVNLYAHRTEDDARNTNDDESGTIKSFRDGVYASAWQRDPDGDQRDVIRDCLPEESGTDDEKSSGDEEEQSK